MSNYQTMSAAISLLKENLNRHTYVAFREDLEMLASIIEHEGKDTYYRNHSEEIYGNANR